MVVPGLAGEINNYGTKKLNGRGDFLGKLHTKLSWGWEFWTKDGYDVITLSKAQQRAFNLRSGDWVVVWDNRLWFPYGSYLETGVKVAFAKFKVGEVVHHMLSIDNPTTKVDLYSSVSAVFAHVAVEYDIRPVLADKQRKAFARWVENKPIRARLPISDLTNTKTDVIAKNVIALSSFCSEIERYVITSFSSYGNLEIQLRLAFSHLRANTVLRYLWNKHHFCGLRYRELYGNVAALYNDEFCIVSVMRASTEAINADRWISSVFPEDVLDIQIKRPILNAIVVGCMDETAGDIYLPNR